MNINEYLTGIKRIDENTEKIILLQQLLCEILEDVKKNKYVPEIIFKIGDMSDELMKFIDSKSTMHAYTSTDKDSDKESDGYLSPVENESVNFIDSIITTKQDKLENNSSITNNKVNSNKNIKRAKDKLVNEFIDNNISHSPTPFILSCNYY